MKKHLFNVGKNIYWHKVVIMAFLEMDGILLSSISTQNSIEYNGQISKNNYIQVRYNLYSILTLMGVISMSKIYGRSGCKLFIGIAVLSIILTVGNVSAVPAEEWNRTFGGTSNDFAHSVLQTSDGGYILAGVTYSYGSGSGDAWLIMTDANGTHLWDRTFGRTGDDIVYSIQQTSDSGFILTGHTTSYGSGLSDAWLIKTDANGNEQWNKTFGGKDDDYAYSVQQTSDEGYILAGKTYSNGSDAWLIKTDASGNELWNRRFRTVGGRDGANIVKQTTDGGYIIVGTTGYQGNIDAWIIKTDADGNKQWNRTFIGIGHDEVYSVFQSSDGGFVIAGQTTTQDSSYDAWLIKTDATGNESWSRTFGGIKYDGAKSVRQTSDGGYIIAGSTDSYGYGADRNYVEGVVYFDVWWDAWLIKTDANGNEQWNKTFGAAGNDQVHSVQQTSEGGYILAGKTSSYGAGRWDFWLIKVGNKDVGIAPSKDTAPTINKSPDKVVFDGLSVQWSKTFGTQYKHDWAESVQQTSDGGYILVGRTGAKSASRSDVLIIKADANGNEQWNSTYGGREHDSAHSVKQTSDGGYVIAGFTNSFGAGNSDVWLFKVDPNGNQQWSKTFGGTKSDGAFTVQLTSDGGYIVAGCTYSHGAASDDVLLIKTDSHGNKQWDRTFGGTGTDIAYSVQQTFDKGYILTGFTFSYGAGSNDFWLIKTDANGNLEWDKTFGGTGDDRAYSVQQTSDGGYILVGFTGSYGSGRSGAWLIKTNKQGNEQWNKTFGGGSAESAKQTSDGGYILAGNVNKDAWLIKTDEIGNEQWNKTFGGTKPGTVFGIHSTASSVQQTSDGGFILAGTTNLYGPGDDDIWLIKIVAEPSTLPGVSGFEALFAIAGLLAITYFLRRRG